MNLLESYKNRLAVSESVYQKSHNGAKMSAQKKLMIATVLNNTSKFMNEAFNSGAATNIGAQLGDYKRFCLNISTVAMPNLILPELMLTQPMTSITGYITYLKYTAGVTKGGVEQGETVFNSVYRHGVMDENRANYTSDRVVETVKNFVTGSTKIAWGPVATNRDTKELMIKFLDADGNELEATGVSVAEDRTVTATIAEGTVAKIAYVYDNVTIPQKNTPNSIPTLTASMDMIQLYARARRIAVYYSQIAAFQAKTDYGFDLAEQLSAQAQGELAYEIDSEGVFMLNKGAEDDASLAFSAYDPEATNMYISRSQYYEQFAEVIARAKKIIYQRTQKFAPNYMVCGANVLTIMPYLKGWTAASVNAVNGPYFAGTVDGLKVFVSPSINENRFFFGVNGSDLQTSAGVYARYMAVVPTQLLGFADGSNSQGFSTMYDMKLLSTYNVKGEGDAAVREDATDGDFSWLLVAGKIVPTDDMKANTIK